MLNIYSAKQVEAFWRDVDRTSENDCWLWNGRLTSSGHGVFFNGGRTVGAHRFSYELVYGEIQHGLIICHRCNEPQCVNPNHLYAGTAKDNRNDRVKARLYKFNAPKIGMTKQADIYSANQVMDTLNIKAVEFRCLVKDGVITAYRSSCGGWVYKRTEIETLRSKNNFVTEKVFTVKEIAEHFKVTRQAVYVWITEGRLQAVKVGNRTRVTETAISNFVRPIEPGEVLEDIGE